MNERIRREWRPFTNIARTDRLRLGHWEKVKDEQPTGAIVETSHMEFAYVITEYPFAKYNTASNVYSYTQEEYSILPEGKGFFFSFFFDAP